MARLWPGGKKRRGGRASHHAECEAFGAFLLPCAATGVSLLAVWCLIGATPRGQPWTPAMTLPHGCNGLSARRLAGLWTFCGPSLCRHGRRELMRNALLDFTPIIPATACHQRNYVETYSRFNLESNGEPALTLFDKPSKAEKIGEPRAILGYAELHNPQTGLREQRSTSSLVFFDKNGKRFWSAP